jgi:hypothetical protein
MPETFCLRLATGLVFALLILPGKAVSPRFYRSQLLIGLCLLVTACVFAWNSAAEAVLLWCLMGVGIGLTVMAFWLWSADGVRLGQVTLGLLAVALSFACLGLHGELAGYGFMPALGEWSSAAFLGIATTAMLLGHWYLIAPTMSIAPLLRLLAALCAANLVRFGVVGTGLLLAWRGDVGFDRLAWMWVVVRLIAGLCAPLGLTWMAWESAKIRSTQSATGILYVVVIFVFFGELTDLLMQGHLAELGGGQG